MIIRGIEVENWRCIDHAALTDLPDGVVVIYGPNGIGKSSLFDAVRCCLFDYDHDSASRQITDATPWGSQASPEVAVEFETSGRRYRLTKVFSKRRDGMASLECWEEGRWVLLENSPKEASRKAREILGCESSKAGLNQLLWLEQGTIALPEDRDLDDTLERRLETILGTLVTAQDLEFKKALDKACGRWFTPTMRQTSSSPILQYQQTQEELEERVAEAKRKVEEAEGLVLQYEETTAEIMGLMKKVALSEKEVEELEEEAEESRTRTKAHEEALRELEEKEKECKAAKKQLDDYRGAEGRLAIAEREFLRREVALGGAEEEYEEAAKEEARADSELRKARRAEAEHRTGQGILDDMQKLVNLKESSDSLRENIGEAQEVEAKVREMEGRLADALAPTKEEIESLRQEFSELTELRASLKAAGLNVTFWVERESTIQASRDGADYEPFALSPDQPTSLSVQQRMSLKIPEFGCMEMGRGETDEDLEDVAMNYSNLQNAYSDAVSRWGEDPRSPDALGRLTERRVRRELDMEQLEEGRAKLVQLAPEGIGALCLELETIQTGQRAIVDRRPELVDWEPDEADLKDRLKAHRQEGERLARVIEQAEARHRGKEKDRRGAESKYGDAKTKRAEAKAKRDAARQEMERLGSKHVLEEAVAKARAERDRAAEDVGKTRLTDAERTVDERLDSARAAFDTRDRRLSSAETRLGELRGQLRGTEGLHNQIVQARQGLDENARMLEGEQLEADAHKQLRELFVECRDYQVRDTLEPVKSRVMDWARHLGLENYRDIRFGPAYLPRGLVSRHVSEDGPVVRLREESYGTWEQLALLVRLALGGVLAKDEPEVAILDDPLAHSDPSRHRRMLDVLGLASRGQQPGAGSTRSLGRLQLIILTCHPDRFDYLSGARQIDFAHEVCVP